MIDRKGARQRLGDSFFVRTTIRMKPRARGIVDDVIVTGGTDSGGDVIQPQGLSQFPGDDVVGARSVPADAESADQFTFFGIKGQAAAKDVHSSDFPADHGIVRLSVIFRRTPVSRIGVYRVTVL